MGSRLPGPICTVTKDYFIDSGTKCVSPSQPPGPTCGDRPNLDPVVEADFKKKYLRQAELASYAMQCESLFGGKDKPSILGGKFLRMYLAHSLDPDAVKAAGEEIKMTKEWNNLERETNSRIQKDVDHLHRLPSEAEVADSARKFLKNKLKKKPGIAFRGSLNSVIGGVGKIEVAVSAQFVAKIKLAAGEHVEYALAVTLFDTYDFANKRDGEYALYRSGLAELLKKNQFCEFDKAYWGEMCPSSSGPRTHLNSKAVLFASFMYALEQRGWTPGPLPWQVTIPMRGTFTHHPTANKGMSARQR